MNKGETDRKGDSETEREKEEKGERKVREAKY